MKAHYHVHTGMRGYIPNQTFYVTTRKDAESTAREEARAWEESFLGIGINEPDERAHGRTRMAGSARSGWYEGPGELSYHYIKISPCTENCDPEEENW